jgi:four helix bundle protein
MKPHKNLNVWQKSFDLVKDLYLITCTFPNDEKFGIVSQIRRAAVSIPVNIAEGAARKSKKEFGQFLYIAAGSTSELDTLLLLSKSLQLAKPEEVDNLIDKVEIISKMLFGLINSVKSDRKSGSSDQ